MAKSPYRPDLKGRQVSAFRVANPPAYAKAQGSVSAVEQIGLIERRSAKLRDKVRSHFNKYEESWVAREAVAIWHRRAGITAGHPAPQGAPPKHAVQSIMADARRNVRARVTQRLMRVNGIKSRMENSVVRNREHQSMRPRVSDNPEPLPQIFKRRSMKP